MKEVLPAPDAESMEEEEGGGGGGGEGVGGWVDPLTLVTRKHAAEMVR